MEVTFSAQVFLTWYILTFRKIYCNIIYSLLSTTCILCRNCHDLNKKTLQWRHKELWFSTKLRVRLVDIFISVHTKAQSTKEKNKLIVSPYFTLSLSTYIKNISVFCLRKLTYIHFNTYFYHVFIPEKCRAIILDMHDVGHKSLSHRCILDSTCVISILQQPVILT